MNEPYNKIIDKKTSLSHREERIISNRGDLGVEDRILDQVFP